MHRNVLKIGGLVLADVKEILEEAAVPPEHPFFYPRICTIILRSNGKTPNTEQEAIQQICSEEFDDLSRKLDRTVIQESTSVRNVLKARLIA